MLIKTVAFIAALTVLGAFAAQNYKTDDTVNNDGLIIKYMSEESGSAQKLFYAESGDYSKHTFALHTIRTESGSYTLSTVMDIAKDYEKTTGKKVECAINGDFFYTSGSPVDTLAIDGSVITTGNFTTKSCFGFDNKGGSVIGRLTQTKMCLRVGGSEIVVDKVNAIPSAGEVSFYTSATAVSLPDCGKYIFNATGSLTDFPVKGTSARMTTGAVTDNNALTLTGGRFAIVCGGDNQTSQLLFKNVKYGVKAEVIKKPSGIYEGMSYIVGGYDKLVEKGELLKNYHTDNAGDTCAPRSILGIKQDGTMFIAVIDGRQSGYSVGITVTDEAALAKSLGAYNAIELDGGGSSTFIVRENDALVLKNKPSDGAMRKVSNAVLIVREESPDTSDSSGSGDSSGSISSSSQSHSTVSGGADSCKTNLSVNAIYVILSFAAVVIIIEKKRSRS